MYTLPQPGPCRNTTQPAPLPESPCSVNAHVEINGLRIQVTGRGHTADEAATNFRATLAAMQPPAPEPPPPLTREQRIAELLTCWLGKAVQRGDFGLVERLSKGAALVLGHQVERSDRANVLAVRSTKNPETWYEVEGRQCTCPGYQTHVRYSKAEHVCKHICAAALWQRLA